MKHRSKQGKRVHDRHASNDFKESRRSALDGYAVKLQSALILHKQGHLAVAEALYREILESQPNNINALHLLGTIAGQRQEFAYALELFEQVLKIDPNHLAALNDRGVVLQELLRHEEALLSYDRVIALKPDFAEGYYHRGNAWLKLKQYNAAIVNYEKAIALRTGYAEAYVNHGLALHKLKRYVEAIVSYEKALTIRPRYAEAYSHYGLALHELRRYVEELLCYERAITMKPDYAEAFHNRGLALHELKRYEEAVLSYDRAIAVNQNFGEANLSRGNSFLELKRYSDALLNYERAIAINPDYAEAHHNCGVVMEELKRYEDAVVSYNRAIALNPDEAFWFGERLYVKMRMCDWSNFDTYSYQLASKIDHHEKASRPFSVLAIIDSLSLQQKEALIYVEDTSTSNSELPEIQKHIRDDKICIGYYSADFQHHATAYLMAELFEQHDRSTFEFIAFSFGPDNPEDLMRKRIAAAFDRFIDVRTKSDKEVVLLSREFGVDIAVDLKGYTQDSRPGIFALRAAPIQVSYLGYPGTMGAEYIDYIIADSTLIPESNQPYYTEKIVYLPNSYQVNDSKRHISEHVFSREELGLPKKGFVFCCFNNNYKITPSTFDGWMRILKQVEGSVFWLFEDNPKAAINLKSEAVQRGINAERLIFAKRMPLPMHLARHRLADLFLDTLPYNAHTTASDALWADLPVLTCMGESFASRVAASLLNAIHLPELITSTQDEYEALAIELATHPEKLKNIKAKLARNRLTTPLFDTQLFTGHLEEAYTAMYERYHADLPPDHIYVKSEVVNKSSRTDGSSFIEKSDDCMATNNVSTTPFFNLLKPDRLTEIVDIRANPIDGDPPYKRMLDSGLCQVTGIEPQEQALSELLQKKGMHETYLPYAVGDGEHHTLNICRASGMTSLFEPNEATLELFHVLKPFGEVVQQQSLKTRRLDDITEIEKLDFLKIAIQGGELAVFQAGKKKLSHAVVIQTKVSFITLYKNQPTLGDIDLELRKQGFVPHCFAAVKKWPIQPCVVNGNPRHALNQLLEADIVYVRDFSCPDLMSHEQLKHLALIAHYCYGSFDLALRCVMLLEQRGILDQGSQSAYLTYLSAVTRGEKQ